MNAHYQTFKNKIKADAAETRMLRVEARELLHKVRTEGDLDARYEAFYKLRKANDERPWRRDQHLAYCYAKGRTYEQCERTCNPSCKLNARNILDHLRSNLVDYGATKDHIKMWLDERVFTRQEVEGNYDLYLATKEVRKEANEAAATHTRAMEILDQWRRRHEEAVRSAEQVKTRVAEAVKMVEEAKTAAQAAKAKADETQARYEMAIKPTPER